MLTMMRDNYRIARRTWRAWRGRELSMPPQLRCNARRIGGDGAAWSVCLDRLSRESVVYSVGVGEEISFDLELIHRLGVIVHAFDPTPKSIAWLERQVLPKEFVFHAYGIAGNDGLRKFVPPRDPGHVSHTVLPRDSPWPSVEAPVRRLSTILQVLGHTRVDLLKMDIEGAEYEVLADLLSARIPIGQLLVEFHHRWPEVGVDKTRAAIRELNAAGYKIFSVSPSGEEYGFIYTEN